MKKKLYSAIFILLLIFLAIPFSIGFLFKQNYENSLKLLSQNLNHRFKLVDYKRSWFFSDATILSDFPLADQPTGNYDSGKQLLIKQRIYHGPIVFTKEYPWIKCRVGCIDSYFDQQHHFAKTTLGLDRSLKTLIALDKYSITHNSKLLYSINGLQGHINLKGNNLTTNIKLKHVFANVEAPREISNFNLTLNLKKNKTDLWTGQQTYHFGELKWRKCDNLYGFQNFNYATLSALHADHYDTKIDANVTSLWVNKINYGSQKISFELNQLKPSELMQLQYNPLSSSQTPSEIVLYQHKLFELLNKGAQLKINTIQLNTLSGRINLTGGITCPCNSHICNFQSLFSKLMGEVNGELPVEIANSILSTYYLQFNQVDPVFVKKSLAEFFGDWQKKGWLQTSGEYYLINCHF